MNETGNERVSCAVVVPASGSDCKADEPLLIEMGIGWTRDLKNPKKLTSAVPRDYVAEIERLRKWRPIDTAPRDADVLLGWWQDWPERQWECAAGLAGSTKGGWLHGQATHWMPLPAPPEDLL